TFGYSVAASGVSNIVVGAPRASEDVQYSGAAYFFGGRSSLGGSVWSDLNNDGIRQSAEFGIAGVTVTLTGKDLLGNPVKSVQKTDANGFYNFIGLQAGTYTVTESQPTRFLDGKDNRGNLGGTVTANDQIKVTIADGDEGLRYNFGELRPASLAGSV